MQTKFLHWLTLPLKMGFQNRKVWTRLNFLKAAFDQQTFNNFKQFFFCKMSKNYVTLFFCKCILALSKNNLRGGLMWKKFCVLSATTFVIHGGGVGAYLQQSSYQIISPTLFIKSISCKFLCWDLLVIIYFVRCIKLLHI